MLRVLVAMVALRILGILLALIGTLGFAEDTPLVWVGGGLVVFTTLILQASRIYDALRKRRDRRAAPPN